MWYGRVSLFYNALDQVTAAPTPFCSPPTRLGTQQPMTQVFGALPHTRKAFLASGAAAQQNEPVDEDLDFCFPSLFITLPVKQIKQILKREGQKRFLTCKDSEESSRNEERQIESAQMSK